MDSTQLKDEGSLETGTQSMKLLKEIFVSFSEQVYSYTDKIKRILDSCPLIYGFKQKTLIL